MTQNILRITAPQSVLLSGFNRQGSMDYRLFKVVGTIAGIGGIALFLVAYIFREIIRKQIFPQLTKKHAYRLLTQIVVLIFVTGVLGLGAYVWLSLHKDVPPSQAEPAAQLWGYIRDSDEQPIQGARISLEDFPDTKSVESASDGRFWLKDLPVKYGDMIRVRVVRDGYQPNPCVKDLQPGSSGSHIIHLRKVLGSRLSPC